jgi:hypothetical protein
MEHVSWDTKMKDISTEIPLLLVTTNKMRDNMLQQNKLVYCLKIRFLINSQLILRQCFNNVN